MKKISLTIIILLYFIATLSGKVMLGIDVLQADNFASLQGKRIGLLTHPAGVNSNGISTVDILFAAKNVKLVALFGPEHGIYGNEKADVPVQNQIDRKTGLPVFSLYGKYRKPTPDMLQKIDTLVVDLQDIGSRSYTYVSCMIRAMEACFEQDKEIIILDRPNPLGGIKVDGPILNKEFKSYVGMLPIPYVHGLTIGELALATKSCDGWMDIDKIKQKKGKLQIIKMKGWNRSMLWNNTGLIWRPTSPAVPSFAAVIGYAMTGLGCQIGPFQHGYGTEYPFRCLTYKGKSPREIYRALISKKISGLDYKIEKMKNGKEGLYIIVNNWNTFRPTELSFHLMRITCEFSGKNLFATEKASTQLLFNKHVGSKAWWNEISTKGANANVSGYVNMFEAESKKFQSWSKIFYLYK